MQMRKIYCFRSFALDSAHVKCALECEKFDKSWVSDASRRKWAWVFKVFEEWRNQRNEAVLKEDYSGEPVIQEDIDEMSDEMLDFTLARFVAEVRKEDGQEYPGKTLYEILSSIQMYLRVQCKRNITLIDKKGCTKKSSCNEHELNANGTVDKVVSYQFLCTLYIKFPKTGCNIFNNCSLHTAIFLILQHALIFRAFNYITLIISLLTKRAASVFLRQLFCHL